MIRSLAGYRKLGLPTDQRKAMLRNLVTSLLKHGKIETTDTRAKETIKNMYFLLNICKIGL